mgnify:FL=1
MSRLMRESDDQYYPEWDEQQTDGPPKCPPPSPLFRFVHVVSHSTERKP